MANLVEINSIERMTPAQAWAELARIAAITPLLVALAGKELPTPETRKALEEDRLIGVREASRLLGLSKTYICEHADDFAFTVRQGRRVLFSYLGIQKYIRMRQRG